MMKQLILKKLQTSVSSTVYARGVQYYENGHIRKYQVIPTGEQEWRLKAVVAGMEEYPVDVQVGVRGQTVYFSKECGCPYDWEDLCKHAVAVIYKFLNESLAVSIDQETPRFRSLTRADAQTVYREFDLLKRLSGELDLPEIQLTYTIKGLAKLAMANFRIGFDFPGATDQELRELYDYAVDSYYGSHSSLVYRQTERTVIRRLSSFDRLVLEHLRTIQARSDSERKNIFIAKSPQNLQFIQTMLGNRTVRLDETQKILERGAPVKPVGYVSGDENRLKIRFDYDGLAEQGLYCQDLSYLLVGSVICPVERAGMERLPLEIAVPPERQGELLFEILPKLRQELGLKVVPNLRAHTLRVIQPQVRLRLDYHDNQVFCEPELIIGAEHYQGLDCFQPANQPQYNRTASESTEWWSVDQQVLETFVNFFNDNQFIVSKDGIVLKDPDAIIGLKLAGLKQLPADWQIEESEAFQGLTIEPMVLEPIVELNPDAEIDWFDFKIYYNLGGKTYSHQEIMAMIRQNQSGQKYLRIDDRIFLIEEAAKLDVINRVLSSGDLGNAQQRQEFFNFFFYRQLLLENGIRVQGNQVYNQLNEDLSDCNLVEAVPLPPELVGELRSYQRDGFYWLRFLHRYKLAGILADDMGLGKTIQVLTLIRSLPEGLPVLVVCPRSLIYNWAAEIDKFYPGLPYLVYHGTPEERERLRRTFATQRVIITTYDIVNRDEKALRMLEFDYCILDEAQSIKNHLTQRTQTVKRIKARHRLAITGTPIENGLEELWSIFDFLMPGYLGAKQKFGAFYANPIQKDGDAERLRLLKQKVAPFILRRRKEEVLAELPEKVIMLQKVLMTQLQEDTYRTILEQVRQEVMDSIRDKGVEKSQITILAALTKLRLVCNHPRLVLPDLSPETESGKLESLMDLVQEARDGGHKVVIFSQFVKMLRLIEPKFSAAGIRYEYLDGSTRDRMERINRFNEDQSVAAFLISLKAGGVGINLTAADIVIHVDPWWNPMTENQATDRVHRIGQRNQVMVYKLIASGTVEEKMLKLQGRKQSIFDAVIEKNQSPVSSLTWEDIRGLFDL